MHYIIRWHPITEKYLFAPDPNNPIPLPEGVYDFGVKTPATEATLFGAPKAVPAYLTVDNHLQAAVVRDWLEDYGWTPLPQFDLSPEGVAQ